MKRKFLVLFLASAMAMGLSACGGAASDEASGSGDTVKNEAEDTETTDSATTDSSSGGDSIRLVNGKIEVDAQLKKLAEMYKEETGVNVEIESMGGGVDIQGTLKGYYQADNMPDIFVNGGSADFANWDGLVEDLSDEAWVADTDAAYTDENGAVIGFPYTIEAIGLAYNAQVLDAAGIDPDTLTSPKAIKEAFETLDSKKDELGITAVVGYATEPVNLYWSTGNHIFANYIDAGLDRDDKTYYDLIDDGGQFDEARLKDFADFVGLLNKYSDPELLISGTYDQQILNFASGKYAFVTQGSWIGATMANDDADAYKEAGEFKCGMVPYAFEDGIDTILTNAPSYWAVFKDGNVAAAKAFLQWLTTDEAQKVLVEEAGFVSPFRSCTFIASDPFAETISDYTAAGKTSAWHWLDVKEGLAQNVLGQIFNDYAAGSLDKDGFVSTIESAVASYYAN